MSSIPFEDGARDLVNFGIAFFNQFSQGIEDAKRTAARNYEDLVARGSQDKSELAENLRKLLHQGLVLIGATAPELPANRPVPAAAPAKAEIILPKKKTRKKAV